MGKTLVFGASLKPHRYSNLAIQRLVAHHKDTVAFGLREGNVAGISVTQDLDTFNDIDTITLYLGPQHQKEYYDAIINLKPRRVIFNPGTENPEFYEILKENNIEVEVACTLVLLGTGQY
ncbi:CoA-binding protein [Allomuricauda sp. d1]|uniref:CoA-binding protein n=1 Tax=Allomuricauda sp. d1 TaxID=3136725 RepID=UPI0031DDA8A7